MGAVSSWVQRVSLVANLLDWRALRYRTLQTELHLTSHLYRDSQVLDERGAKTPQWSLMLGQGCLWLWHTHGLNIVGFEHCLNLAVSQSNVSGSALLHHNVSACSRKCTSWSTPGNSGRLKCVLSNENPSLQADISLNCNVLCIRRSVFYYYPAVLLMKSNGN